MVIVQSGEPAFAVIQISNNSVVRWAGLRDRECVGTLVGDQKLFCGNGVRVVGEEGEIGVRCDPAAMILGQFEQEWRFQQCADVRIGGAFHEPSRPDDGVGVGKSKYVDHFGGVFDDPGGMGRSQGRIAQSEVPGPRESNDVEVMFVHDGERYRILRVDSGGAWPYIPYRLFGVE